MDEFNCPACQLPVRIRMRGEAGTSSRGGLGIVLGTPIARCENCERDFGQTEIELLTTPTQ